MYTIINANEKSALATLVSSRGYFEKKRKKERSAAGSDIYLDSARSWHSLTRASTFAPRIPAERAALRSFDVAVTFAYFVVRDVCEISAVIKLRAT